tara:strand:- start:63 stop:272 length:210 start_codon:yes stop_codon:yes gene_type:complete
LLHLLKTLHLLLHLRIELPHLLGLLESTTQPTYATTPSCCAAIWACRQHLWAQPTSISRVAGTVVKTHI